MAAMFVLSITIITVGTWLVSQNSEWPGTMFYEPVNPAVLMLSASAFMIVKLTVSKVPLVVTRMRDFASKYNYGIYLSHALVLYFLDDPFGISYKLGMPVLSIPFTALICFVISLLLVWIINKIPFVGKWVSG